MPSNEMWQFNEANSPIESDIPDNHDIFRAFFESSIDCILVANIHSNKITFVNPKMCELTGYSVSELLQLRFNQLYPDEDMPYVRDQFKKQTQGDHILVSDFPMLKKDGTIIYCDVNSRTIDYGDQSYILSTFRNNMMRRQTKAKLRAERDRAQQYLDVARVILVALDTERKITMINKIGCQILGYNVEELLGKDWVEVFYPEEIWKEAKTNFHSVFKGQSHHLDQTYERTVLTKTGEKLIFVWSNTLLRDQTNTITGILGCGEDITERIIAENALKEREQRYHTLFENIHDAAFILSLDKNDHRHLAVNQQAIDMFGYERDELLEMNTSQLNIPGEVQAGTEKIDAVLKGEILPIYERNAQHKDGTIIPTELSTKLVYDVEGNPLYIQVIARDITERKRIEAALQESEARYRQLFEEAPISLFEEDFSAIKPHFEKLRQNGIVDFQTYFVEHPEAIANFVTLGRVVDVNKFALNMYNAKNKEELIGDLSLFITKDGYDGFKAGLISFANGYTVFENESVNQTINGDIIHINMRWVIAPGYEDTWGKIFISIDDITIRKQMEEARCELEENRANFIAITSHELRTPLTSIRGYSELLTKQIDKIDQTKREQCFIAIERNIQRLERLIISVNTLSQIEKGLFNLEMQQINFRNLLVEALQPYQIQLGSQLQVSLSSQDIPVFIEGDYNRLLQVFDNIIVNAVKHTPLDHRLISVTSETRPHSIRVLIEDNGAGIAPENLSAIFEPFISFSSHYSTSGMGIGLFLSRNLIEDHGGTLNVMSLGLDHGSTFIIDLPR